MVLESSHTSLWSNYRYMAPGAGSIHTLASALSSFCYAWLVTVPHLLLNKSSYPLWEGSGQVVIFSGSWSRALHTEICFSERLENKQVNEKQTSAMWHYVYMKDEFWKGQRVSIIASSIKAFLPWGWQTSANGCISGGGQVTSKLQILWVWIFSCQVGP